LDTKGPEIRTGFFEEGLSKLELVKGQELILTSDYSVKGNAQKLACSYASLATSVTPGQQILVGTFWGRWRLVDERMYQQSHPRGAEALRTASSFNCFVFLV